MKFTFAPETKPLDGYTIKRAIDRGGFGEVYYALSDSGKEVALKLIQQNEETELRGVAQCLNLKHPNLVTLFDVRQDRDGDHWIVMEYVSGKGLDQVIAERPAGMPPAEIEPWLEGIAAGIAFLHDRGIVHRDVKPANIFREHNVVKVGDVGLSKFMSPSKRSAQTESVGTVYYMAPEVARGRYGPEVDVYSLGVIVYEMLTGRVPFDGESSAEILMKHLTQPPDLNVPEITAAMRPVLANALAKDPQHRTRSVTQLLTEFRQAVSGKKVAQEIPPESFVTAGANKTAPRPPVQPAWPMGNPMAPALASRRPTQAAGLPWLLLLGTIPAIGIAEWSPILVGPYMIAVVGAFVFAFAKLNQSTTESGRSAIQWRQAMHEIHLGLTEWRGPILLVLTVVLAAFSRRTIFRGIPFSEALFVLGGSGVLAWVAYRVTLHLVRQFGGAMASMSQPMAASATAASPRPVPRVVTPVVVQRRPHVVPASRHLDPTTVRPVAFRNRCIDLTHSMTAAVFFTALFTPLVGWLTPLFGDGNTWPGDLGSWGLFAVTTLLSSWGVLVHSKLWEGRPSDNWLRRLTALALGAGVGAAAYSMHDLLLVHMNYDLLDTTPVLTNLGSRSLLTADVQPTLTGFMAFFGGLFAVRRWWWLADAFRSNRLRIASVVMTSVLAAAVCVVFGFHATWGVTWATVTACVVQLAAVWVPDNVRRNGTT